MEMIKDNINKVVQAIKMMYKVKKSSIFIFALSELLKSIMPFTTIILMARVVSELEKNTPVESIIKIVIIGAVIIFAIGIIGAIAEKYALQSTEYSFQAFRQMKGEVALNLDYQQLISADTKKLRTRITQENSWGAGYYTLVNVYRNTCKNLFSLIIAIIIILPLFSAIGGMKNLTALSLFLFFGFVVIAAIITSRFRNKKINNSYKLFDNFSTNLPLLFHFIYYKGLKYSNGKDIRIFKAQSLISSHTDSLHKEHQQSFGEVGRMQSSGYALHLAVTTLIQGTAYLFVAMQAINGMIDIGSVIKYAGSIFQFSVAFSGLIAMLSQFVLVCGRFTSTIDFFNIPEIMYKGSLPIEKRRDNEYEIEFKNVSFKYPGSDEYALKNFSIRFKIGQRLAIVGMNGSGKTTMIKLLCRLYDVTDGEILLNDVNIKKYDYQEYISIFSVVFQDFKLYSFSLGQNVAANMEFDEEKAKMCLREAGLSKRIGEMPKGLNTPLYKNFDKDGVEISGGEAQKIAIARALYKDAPFVILDEPTASLDPISEFEVYSKFNEMVKDKTAIYISHRLSSCRFCDHIAVFHEGELVQQGNHESLIKNESGKYYQLWNAQAQYYKRADNVSNEG